MKIVRFSIDDTISYGVQKEDLVQQIAGTPFAGIIMTDRYFKYGEIDLLAPCTPTKIVAIGINYRSHAIEFGHELPQTPLMFLKPASAVIGPGEKIVYPEMSSHVDYEGEVGVVIGKQARFVEAENAAKHILGYTCFNDVTARDLQRKDGQWTRAKGFDTFAALGPCIETDLNPSDIRLETWQNGTLKQESSTSDLIFSIPQLVSFVSRVMTLMPGDIIASGTPSGVGPVQAGDIIEVRIEGVGTLANAVTR